MNGTSFDRARRARRQPAWYLAAITLCAGVAACDTPRAQDRSTTSDAATDALQFREFGLTIYGYNYTDTEIGSFEVNGRGGGNLAVSTPTAGGSKSVCCAPLFTPLPENNKMHVKWTRDSDTWCEQDVAFTGPVPGNARYLEVHFYQDGHIEIAATPDFSPPRLKLQRLHGNSRHTDLKQNVNNDSKHSRCKLGYR